MSDGLAALTSRVRKLAAGGIEFVLIGGYAAVAHGVSLGVER